MPKTTWLHFSDFHIFMNDPAWENYIRCLKEQLTKMEHPDFLVITGDYHNVWAGEGFDKGERFIRDLMTELGLNLTRDLFMIPGNHDMCTQRKKTVKHFPHKKKEIDDDPRTHEMKKLLPSGLLPWERSAPQKEWLDKHESDPANYLDRLCHIARSNAEDENMMEFDSLLKGFSDYCKLVELLIPFYRQSGINPGVNHPRKWEKSGKASINIIHLNTAIIADGSRNHYQAVNLHQAQDVLNGINNGLPTLVLAHNSFYDLHPRIQEQLITPLSNANVCAWLCGDAHRFSKDREIARPSGDARVPIPIVVCGRGAIDHKDSYSENGFLAYSLDEEKIKVTRFAWLTDHFEEKEELSILVDVPHPESKRLVIGYLSCNPSVEFEAKYHLGHAYFIHKMDRFLQEGYYAVIMTSSFLQRHNRSEESIKADTRYVSDMLKMWENCFHSQVKVLDIKDYFSQSLDADAISSSLINYIQSMETKMECENQCHIIVRKWFETGQVSDPDYEYIQNFFDDKSGSPAEKNELMSFAYLLHKRPMWYSSLWLLRFMNFWNRYIYYLIVSKLNIPVEREQFFIIESKRNRYVWDAITYCAKRFSYMNIPKVECFDSLLDIDCEQPMKSSNRDKAVFLADSDSRVYSDTFVQYVKQMFGEDRSPNQIAQEYYSRLFSGSP